MLKPYPLLMVVFTLPLLVWTGCSKDDSGAELYDTACSRCHGSNGQGGTDVPTGLDPRDLSNAGWQDSVTDDDLRRIVRDGRGQMKGFGGVLSLDRIDLIVKHIRTLKVQGSPAPSTPSTPPTPPTPSTPPEPPAPPAPAATY
jgi:mono/diheme cytochrome c family protein